MTNQEITLLTEVIKGGIGLAVVVVTPFVIKVLKAIEEKVQTDIGSNNFAFLKSYILDLYKLHSDLFTEANLDELIEQLIEKFGAKISEDTIKMVVNLVIKDIENVVTPTPVPTVEPIVPIIPEVTPIVPEVIPTPVVEPVIESTIQPVDNVVTPIV